MQWLDDGSRMSGDVHVRFCEHLRGRFPRVTRRNIFVKSQKAAERVMEKVSQFIEKKLKLKVNQEKSQVALSDKVKFLGFTVVNGTIAIAHKALQTAMDKVKALTPRGTHKALEPALDKINQPKNRS